MNYMPDVTMTEMFWTGTSRLNRLRYLKRNLALVLFFFVTLFAIMMALGITAGFGDVDEETLLNHPTIVLSVFILHIVVAVLSYKLDVRRLKDLGKGKLLAVINLVLSILGAEIFALGIITLLINLYLLFAPGEQGPNMYGADPLGV